jgi:hypothetical protein
MVRRGWEALYGRTMRVDQLDGCEWVLGYFLRLGHREGPKIVRSLPQAASGIGWPSLGTVRADHDRYRSAIIRRLAVGVELGLIESFRPVYGPDGRGVGIEVVVTPKGLSWAAQAPIAQVDRATGGRRRARAGRRGSPPPAPSFLGGEVLPPCGAAGAGFLPCSPPLPSRDAGVRALTRGGDAETMFESRARAPEAFERGAALDALRSTVITEKGARGALLASAAAGMDALVVGVVAFELRHQRHPALTAQRREHLQRACRLLDRLAGRVGAGAQLLVDLILVDGPDPDEPAGFEPTSLGYYVCRLRMIARADRRVERGLDRITTKTLADGRELRGDWQETRIVKLGAAANRRRNETFGQRRPGWTG